VKGLFRRESFTGLGPCPLLGYEPEMFCGPRGRAARSRACVRRDVPRVPGVYGMIDAAGELIYVGKAKSLRSRLMTYFQKGREEKAARIIRETRRLVWEPADSEFAAVLRELALIRRHRPRWNVQGQPRRQRRMYVCLGRRPALYAFSSAKPTSTAAHAFGPFPGMRRTRDAVNRLNDWFRLRDCPQKQTMHFAGQGELFPVIRTPGCLRHEIGHCLAPCAAACTRQEYAAQADAALAFLRGADGTAVETLQGQMEAASAEQKYERAAALRDRLAPLEWLWKHLARLREARQVSGVYPAGGAWYVIRHGVVRLRLSVGDAEAARRVLLAGPRDPGPAGLDEVDGLLLVAGWFRRHRAERERLLGVEAI
jgi:excinuclease ABC subunit C